MAQQRGLEPPILCRIPAFQAGRLPLSHCCIGSGSWVRTYNPLGQNQVLFQLSYAAIWAQAEQGSTARANRGKEENNMARFRGWRQRRASNPQARRPPVFRTGWHSHLPSLPYWKSWTPCAILYLYYMHFIRNLFPLYLAARIPEKSRSHILYALPQNFILGTVAGRAAFLIALYALARFCISARPPALEIVLFYYMLYAKFIF